MARTRVFPPDSVLLRQGDDSDHVLVILDGWAAVTMADQNGKEVMLDLAGPNDLLGEEAALHGRIRAATVTCLSQLSAYIIPSFRFEAVLEEHPRVWKVLHRVATQRREERDRRVQAAACLDGTQRLAHLLVQLAARFGTRAEDGSVSIGPPLTQQQLGSWVDVSRLTAARAFGTWRKQNLVRTGHRKINILDVDGLSAQIGSSLQAPSPWPRLPLQPKPPAPASSERLRSTSPTGPGVLRILLGARLRRLREERGIAREEAGYAIRASDSKISRLERGRMGFKARDVADLLTLYGVHEESQRRELLDLAERANSPAWWSAFLDIVPSWFEVYIGLEDGASTIRAYEPQFVPGLVQTEEYARALITLGQADVTAQEIDRRVALRMTRQAILHRPGSPSYWVVVDEAALRRPLGGRQVIRRQIEELIRTAAQPNITLQILPFHRVGHVTGGSFSILRFSEPDLPDIVYLEQFISAVYLDKQQDVESYTATMDQLCTAAEPPDRTPEILRSILAEHY